MSTMKLIEVHRGVMGDDALILANGDRYDGRIKVYSGYSEDTPVAGLKELAIIPFVNGDHTEGYAGGKLAAGDYYFIVGLHKSRYKALFVFDRDSEKDALRLNGYQDLSLEDRTMPSAIPNPNHNNQHIIVAVNVHKGGLNWDWSHGCITIVTNSYLHNYWKDFIDLFAMNEVGRIRICD
jgi:hypothetical protein